MLPEFRPGPRKRGTDRFKKRARCGKALYWSISVLMGGTRSLRRHGVVAQGVRAIVRCGPASEDRQHQPRRAFLAGMVCPPCALCREPRSKQRVACFESTSERLGGEKGSEGGPLEYAGIILSSLSGRGSFGSVAARRRAQSGIDRR